jgi:hypothetical protein
MCVQYDAAGWAMQHDLGRQLQEVAAADLSGGVHCYGFLVFLLSSGNLLVLGVCRLRRDFNCVQKRMQSSTLPVYCCSSTGGKHQRHRSCWQHKTSGKSLYHRLQQQYAARPPASFICCSVARATYNERQDRGPVITIVFDSMSCQELVSNRDRLRI